MDLFYVKRKGRIRAIMFYSMREWANIFCISDKTVRRWIQEGMPSLPVGDEVHAVQMIPNDIAFRWVRRKKPRSWRKSEEPRT